MTASKLETQSKRRENGPCRAGRRPALGLDVPPPDIVRVS